MSATLKIKGQSLVVAGCLAAVALLALLAGALAVEAGPEGQHKAGVQQTSMQVGQQTQPMSPVGTGFTYQGRLKNGGNPANGAHDFTFKLYDALTGGSLVSGPISVTAVVTDGLFTVALDFGQNAFQGQARWLEVAVRPAGVGTYTTLSPRQALSATPYAAGLVPGATITGSLTTPMLSVSSSAGTGLYSTSTGWNASGVYGVSSTGSGVRGESISGAGVYGSSFATDGAGVYGSSFATNGAGVYGFSNTGSFATGVYGGSASGTGVWGSSAAANGRGVYGEATNGSGASGVRGESVSGGYGVYGSGGYGVYGHTAGGYGVYGYTSQISGVGVYGAVLGGMGTAGYFDGDVEVFGSCCAAGVGTSKIDHPLDPENQYLFQALVESPDMKNVYDGNVTTDAKGEAVVPLPAYVEALNKDFRYQLTIVGDVFAQARVSSKITDNRFTIKTDKPNVEVSWQVTGIRKDPYARAHPLVVEQEKKAEDKGKYRHHKEWGQPESKGVNYEERRLAEERAKPSLPEKP